MKVAHIYLLLPFMLIVAGCNDTVEQVVLQNTPEFTPSKRANIWYFGQHAGLDFNDLDADGNPSVLTDGQINTLEGCSVICDENGQFLFYTDGVTVWNQQHEVMPNGTELKGSFTSTQSALIVPHPGNDALYYIFTTAAQAQPDGLNYHMVDMAQDGGLGDVVLKNVQLYTPTTEKLTAVHHANGEDVWVITHQWESDAFLVYHVTKEGLGEIPVISHTGSVHEYGVSNANAIGEMKASPSGKLIALNIHEFRRTETFHFNIMTGEVHFKDGFVTPVIYAGDINGYILGIAFSPNEQYIYFSVYFPDTFSGQSIYQYNLKSKVSSIIDTVHVGGGLQLGPDRRLYASNKDRKELLVIRKPNLPFDDPDFKISRVSLAPGFSRFSLPNFIQSYFYVPDPVVQIPNTFTPNGDGKNEWFEPQDFANVETFEMTIVDRSGVEVFRTTKPDIWWNGGELSPGVYYWNLRYEGINGKEGFQKGWVQLVR